MATYGTKFHAYTETESSFSLPRSSSRSFVPALAPFSHRCSLREIGLPPMPTMGWGRVVPFRFLVYYRISVIYPMNLILVG